MRSKSSYRLSTLVAVAICGMAIVTALALGGVFSYSYFNTLKNEFHDRIKAEGEESSLEIYSYLHRAMSRLGELSRDNSIRVSMMMGVDYPLTEKLSEYDQIPLGIDYFVLRSGDTKIFSSSSKKFDELILREALEEPPHRCSFCRNAAGEFITVFSMPIRSRSEVVGSAACLVNFSRAGLDFSQSESSKGKLIIFEQGRAYDLLSGEALTVSFGDTLDGDMTSVSMGNGRDGVLYRSSLVSGLAYFVSNERLEDSLYSTFWLLLPLFGAVIGLCVVVSLILSSKLARPLKLIAVSAEGIANGHDDEIQDRESRIYEINALSGSLSSMLESLRKSKGLEQYQFFFDNVADLVCLTDINGLFLKINSRGTAFLGYEHGEFLKKTIFELVPAYERQSLNSILNSLFTENDSRQFDCSMITKSGVSVFAEIRSRRITYQGQDVLLSVVRDITDRKSDEEELQRYAEELLRAKEVEERNSAHMAETLKKLEDAMARAEVANRAKSDFLAQMSHEIRTPMNSILGMADMLGETRLTAEQKSYVSIFRNSGKALMNLINDILDLSKIESGKLTLEETRFNLDELVDEIAGIMSVSAWKKGLAFACYVAPETPTFFVGDPTRIKQIVVNLLSNAIKFTDSGVVLMEVSSSSKSEDSSVLSMVVRDSGIGISEDKFKTIFENFVQADSSTTRKYGGTGLGLSITRNLVELMNGKIAVRNLPSGGAEFRTEIVLGRVDDVDADAGRIRAVMQDREILVIDDSPLIRNYICSCLNEWGARASQAGDLNLACVQSESGRSSAELIIVSDRLGEEDGIGEVETLKARLNSSAPAVCTISVSPGNSSSRPEINYLFGVKGSIRWPITRGGILRAMLDIYCKSIEFGTGQEEEIELSPLRILVADDSDNNRMLLDFFLKDTPFRLSYAEDGEKAVEMYMKHNFDLVLMDMQMPVKDGYEATGEIRAYEVANGYPATPVVALTANAYDADRKRCHEAGCSGFIAKPVKKISLIKAILKYGS